MSAIDDSKHVLLGYFLGLPVYLLEENNSLLGHRNPQDGHRIPEHLSLPVIPCGSIVILGGTHVSQVLAFYDPVHCVARYIQFNRQFDPDRIGPDILKACKNLQGDLQTIEYCNWTNQAHLDFRQLCQGAYARYQEMLGFEGWLLLVVGDFVYHVMPSIDPSIGSWRDTHGLELPLTFELISAPYNTR